MINGYATEFRHAWRAIANRPAFSALVVAVLAVASIVNGMVVEPLPFAEPERLHYAGLVDNGDILDTDDPDSPNVDELLEWRERLVGHAEIAGYATATVNFSDGERPERRLRERLVRPEDPRETRDVEQLSGGRGEKNEPQEESESEAQAPHCALRVQS